MRKYAEARTDIRMSLIFAIVFTLGYIALIVLGGGMEYIILIDPRGLTLGLDGCIPTLFWVIFFIKRRQLKKRMLQDLLESL